MLWLWYLETIWRSFGTVVFLEILGTTSDHVWSFAQPATKPRSSSESHHPENHLLGTAAVLRELGSNVTWHKCHLFFPTRVRLCFFHIPRIWRINGKFGILYHIINHYYTQKFIFLNLPSNRTHQASQRPALEGPKVPGSLRALRLDTVDDHHIR
jgi:hypothetical protein